MKKLYWIIIILTEIILYVNVFIMGALGDLDNPTPFSQGVLATQWLTLAALAVFLVLEGIARVEGNGLFFKTEEVEEDD